MIKIRLWGETAEVNAMAEFLSKRPQVRVLSCSENYKDRGASVYTRVYLDVELHKAAKINEDFETALTKQNK